MIHTILEIIGAIVLIVFAVAVVLALLFAWVEQAQGRPPKI